MHWIEIIGYGGSLLIAVSLMMNNIRRLRWINLFGAGTFATYGLLVHAHPVLLLNSFIALTDIYYLVQFHRKKDLFTISQIPPGANLFRDRFLTFFERDIRRFFPDFRWDRLQNPRSVFILRNLLPVGLFVYQPLPEGVAEIHLDYVRPEYRDFKNAYYLYHSQMGLLREEGIVRLRTRSRVKAHQKYLLRLGFRVDPADAQLFHKEI